MYYINKPDSTWLTDALSVFTRQTDPDGAAAAEE